MIGSLQDMNFILKLMRVEDDVAAKSHLPVLHRPW